MMPKPQVSGACENAEVGCLDRCRAWFVRSTQEGLCTITVTIAGVEETKSVELSHSQPQCPEALAPPGEGHLAFGDCSDAGAEP
jgi:hypothetical protein